MSDVDPVVLARIDALQLRYADALDRKDMEAWLATFATVDEASYSCTTVENEGRGLPLGFMLDDSHARLRDRVTYVTKIWAGTFQDYRTRHFVQRVHAQAGAHDVVACRTNFSIFYTPEETGQSQLLVVGVYHDRIAVAGGRALFLDKRALLDTTVLPRYLVYPV